MRAHTVRFPDSTWGKIGAMTLRKAQESGDSVDTSDVVRECVEIGLEHMRMGTQGAKAVDPPVFQVPFLQAGRMSDPHIIRVVYGPAPRPIDCEIYADTSTFCDFVPITLRLERLSPANSSFRVHIRSLEVPGSPNLVAVNPSDGLWDGVDLEHFHEPFHDGCDFRYRSLVCYPMKGVPQGELRVRIPNLEPGKTEEVAFRLWLLATFPMYADRFPARFGT